MKKSDISYIVSAALIILLAFTGITGFIQSQLDLRKFVPHKYAAYTSLVLSALHLYFHWGKLFGYIKIKLRKIFKH